MSKAAAAAAVAMKPSTITMRPASAAPSIAPAIIAISNPPYSCSAVTPSNRAPVRAAARSRTARFRASPASSTPVPRPTRSPTAIPVSFTAISAAADVFPIPISPKATA